MLGFTGDRAEAFEIFIQLGAILAVAWEERRRLAEAAAGILVDGGWSRLDSPGWKLAINLAAGFLPSAFLGLALHDFIEETLFAPVYAAWGLLLGAAGILVVEAAHPAPRTADVAGVSWKQALGVGLAQCLSLFPGTSRSAATILGGMVAGLGRRAATEFSFLLAIPTMLAASLYSLWAWRHVISLADAPGFALGFVIAFVSGFATVKFLLRYVATHDFKPFAYYRIVVGLVALWVLRRA